MSAPHLGRRRRRRGHSKVWGSALVAVGVAGLIGSCAAQPERPSVEASIVAEDLEVITELSEIAAEGIAPEEAIGHTECWYPSQHMIDESRFRVICRVHYTEANAARYRDMICIGDLLRDPVTDHCYQWAPYSDTPAFEDSEAVSA